MNIEGTFTNNVRYPTNNYYSFSMLSKNTVADMDTKKGLSNRLCLLRWLSIAF